MVSLCPSVLHSKFSAKSFISPKYACAGTFLSMQEMQSQLPGTSAQFPLQHEYLQQKEPWNRGWHGKDLVPAGIC